ncbi:hypothetical protein BpHYR1_032386 [Brachionus plicatilis]|uniref:Uncharacterized protein n=1 Tax=Brachionus plicatilis TaxID=10195 RepID=A0A3M7SH97_BRAPC|nr:hypothetical protein BpHYR1_032386 [Brachionus plicatilis]
MDIIVKSFLNAYDEKNEDFGFRFCRFIKSPILSEMDKKSLIWCLRYIYLDFKNYIFVDEKAVRIGH